MALLLMGCSGGGPSSGNSAASAASPAVDDGKVDCAIGAGADWAHDCLMDRSADIVTLRHPDGGFRRFLIVRDGRGLVSADGAEQAKLEIVGSDTIEVTVGANRYRLPAKITAPAR